MFKGKILTIDGDSYARFKDILSGGDEEYHQERIAGTPFGITVDLYSEDLIRLENFLSLESFVPIFLEEGSNEVEYKKYKYSYTDENGDIFLNNEIRELREVYSLLDLEKIVHVNLFTLIKDVIDFGIHFYHVT